jgi:glycosyltransferase involved in cell wall biosynthesis
LNRGFTIAMVAACPFPFPRGTPIRVYRMAHSLAERGHDVHVVTYHLGQDAPDAPFTIHRLPHIPTYRKTSPGPAYQKLLVLDPLLVVKLRRLLASRRFDVIHAHHFEGLLVATAARRRGAPPVVFDVHTLLESELPHYGLGLPAGVKRRVGRALDRWLPRRAEHVIAVTEGIRVQLVANGAAQPEQVSVIPTGVELGVFGRVSRPQPARNGSRTVIFAGNLAPYQGIELMLEAFRTVRARRPDVRLVIATEDDFERYEPRAVDLGVRPFIDVRRVGFADVPALLSDAEVALHPRVACDGLPQKLLNYLAAGKPVVSFHGSAKHLVNGENAMVVADNDTGAFAAAIERLLADDALATRLGEAGRKFVHETLTWSSAAERIENVYRGLA